MEGGATGGYCAIGSCVIATLPPTRMKSAMTHAKMGRSMKKRAMWAAPLAARGRSGGRGGCGRRGRTGLPRHRVHRRAGHHHLLEAVDDHLLAGLQAVGDEPALALGRADLDVALLRLVVGTDHEH